MAAGSSVINTVVRTVGIFSKPNSQAAMELVPELLRWLKQRGIATRLDNETARYAGMLVGLDRAHLPEGCDLAVVLGGDGTLLWASHLVCRQPMVAVNTAPRDSVGYFCAGTKDNLEEVLVGAIERTLPSTELTRVQITLDR